MIAQITSLQVIALLSLLLCKITGIITAILAIVSSIRPELYPIAATSLTITLLLWTVCIVIILIQLSRDQEE